jgi:hypothetical protein
VWYPMKVLPNRHNFLLERHNASGFIISVVGFQNKLELAVGVQCNNCTNCTQGAVLRRVSQELCPIQVNGDTLCHIQVNGDTQGMCGKVQFSWR